MPATWRPWQLHADNVQLLLLELLLASLTCTAAASAADSFSTAVALYAYACSDLLHPLTTASRQPYVVVKESHC